ncbi:unnamed protein product [Clonostachys rosea]|uniref:Cep57 centrosome microtubule-binding domain-containing protein n=1 Tax=Bionectria ochroleuca TaxID=29856 RepID=A0ABY6TUQ4_BIOOC|nr:unnamed protein product [Clonostachys rosea]
MQTVPSLVGAGTAIAAAASGLVFGEVVDPPPSTGRPVSHSTTRLHNQQPFSTAPTRRASFFRPGTSSAASTSGAQPQQHSVPPSPVVSRPPLSRYQRPRSSQVTSPGNPRSRAPSIKQGESSFNTIPETPRASFSSSKSNASWIRRLSLRPLSRQGSQRSSIGPDSTPTTFPHAPSSPVLPQSSSFVTPHQQSRSVKRTQSSTNDERSVDTRLRSRFNLAGLRRPATSDQRCETPQSFRSYLDPTSSPYSRDTPSPAQDLRSSPHLLPSPLERGLEAYRKTGWRSFFHSRTKRDFALSPGRPLEKSPQSWSTTTKRILIGENRRRGAYLVKPTMVSGAPGTDPQPEKHRPVTIDERPDPFSESHQSEVSSVDNTPSKRARRSISMTFVSAGSWVSRTSGSLRRPKRDLTPKRETHRHVSEPLTGSRPTSAATRRIASANQEPPIKPTPLNKETLGRLPTANSQLSVRKRNSSSPATPPSRVPSFQVELARLGSAGGPYFQQAVRPNQPSGSSISSTAMSQLRSQPNGRISIVDSSDCEPRDFMSGDEEDTDFKSDTMFDSIRTVASGRARNVETPLDSMYDESPPSTAGNGRAKRLSIQEILGQDWDGSNKIMEEDEAFSTPVRTAARQDQPAEPRFSTDSSGHDYSLAAKGFGRVSIDDDFDEDWTKDIDGPFNALSPPSKGSSANSRKINPNVRLALANISGNGMIEHGVIDIRNERPLSNLFDWSEPSVYAKQDPSKPSARPRTAYTNQETDARGGRPVVRKVPAPTHVRSQSVPVVHEAPDESKSTGSKYGTWGMGTKPISEDWDDDFEFGGSLGSGKHADGHFAVPESIQATQPSVKAHSGQIRELSLLVNDLQRLCRHGRELEILSGPYHTLWKEAEGIIALASPDDDDAMEGDKDASSVEGSETNERFFDDGFDVASLDRLDAALDGREPAMSKTTVVRDRPSPRRRSVFSPDDDIFGGGVPLYDEPRARTSRPRTPETKLSMAHDVNGVVRTVVEAMQQSAHYEPVLETPPSNKRMHFDTNSLKVLVKRASDLRDILSEFIRKTDQITQSPIRTPRHERYLESSPAFTRMFDDPASSPPRRMSNVSDDKSPQHSPSSGLGRRMQMMKVK